MENAINTKDSSSVITIFISRLLFLYYANGCIDQNTTYKEASLSCARAMEDGGSPLEALQYLENIDSEKDTRVLAYKIVMNLKFGKVERVKELQKTYGLEVVRTERLEFLLRLAQIGLHSKFKQTVCESILQISPYMRFALEEKLSVHVLNGAFQDIEECIK